MYDSDSDHDAVLMTMLRDKGIGKTGDWTHQYHRRNMDISLATDAQQEHAATH